MLTKERAQEIIEYAPCTGKLTWKVSLNSRSKAGAEAGYVGSNGYSRLKIDGVHYLAHRVAWLIHYGHWPSGQLDHIDNNRNNNAISNLRECTNAQNQHNQPLRRSNRSGIKGVSWCSTKGKWHVQARSGGKIHQGGYFANLEDAGLAATALRNELHGEFAKHR